MQMPDFAGLPRAGINETEGDKMVAKKWMTVVAMTLALGAAGCTSKPIYNVQAEPITSNKTPLTSDDVAKAIVRAGAGLGWQMAEVQPGLVTGTLHLRTHVAVVDVKYDTKTYSITYKDSTNLDYTGSEIHRNYNGWVQNLDKAIHTQLSML
jgi:hypothetical protein